MPPDNGSMPDDTERMLHRLRALLNSLSEKELQWRQLHSDYAAGHAAAYADAAAEVWLIVHGLGE